MKRLTTPGSRLATFFYDVTIISLCLTAGMQNSHAEDGVPTYRSTFDDYQPRLQALPVAEQSPSTSIHPDSHPLSGMSVEEHEMTHGDHQVTPARLADAPDKGIHGHDHPHAEHADHLSSPSEGSTHAH